MYKKAVLFEDYEIAEEILKSTNPGKIKQLGRKVKGFDDGTWKQHCLHFVKEGNIAKFTQSERLKKAIVTTYPKVLVEANPYDKVWGIGLTIQDRRAQNKDTWYGKNCLGYILTEVRDELMCQWGLIKEEKKSTYIDKLKENWSTCVDDGSQEESMIDRQIGNHSYDHSQSNQAGDKMRRRHKNNSSISDESEVPNVESLDWEHVEKEKRGKTGKKVQRVPETDMTSQGSARHIERDNKHMDTLERSGHAAKTEGKDNSKNVIVEDFDINVVIDGLSQLGREKMPPSSHAKIKGKGKLGEQHATYTEVVPKAETVNSDGMSGQVMSRRQRRNLKKKQN